MSGKLVKKSGRPSMEVPELVYYTLKVVHESDTVSRELKVLIIYLNLKVYLTSINISSMLSNVAVWAEEIAPIKIL